MRALVLLTLLAAVTIAGSGCGDGASSSGGRPTDHAFASEMVPHHEGALEMADLAQARAEHPELRRLAGRIIASQRAEIAVLRSARDEFQKDGVPVGELGLSEAHMAEGDVDRLRDASDFDRAFIEAMITHHGGAMDMAAVELRNGQNARLKELARSIIEAQQREIQQMEGWFADWYGEESPQESGGHGG